MGALGIMLPGADATNPLGTDTAIEEGDGKGDNNMEL